MTASDEVTLLDLINEKFEHIKTELLTIKDDVKEIKQNCKEGRAICAIEFKDCDRRLDEVEAQSQANSEWTNAQERDLEHRLARRQILSNGISGILGAIAAAIIMFFKGWI